MSVFRKYDLEDAPEEARETLAAVRRDFGFVPNLERYLAGSPVALKAYVALWDLFAQSHFTPVEQEVVYLTANFRHGCDYCMAAHSGLARAKGMPAPVLQALRDGKPLPDARLEALRGFTLAMIERRGWVEQGELENFLAAGFTPEHVLDLITGIATKIISNYTNHLTGTEVDRAFERYRWVPPAGDEA